MSARRFYLVVALVSVAVAAALLALSPTAETEATPEPMPVVARPPSAGTPADASAPEPAGPDTTGAAVRGINLALVIDGNASRFRAIPEDTETLLRELTAAVEAGVPDAADELFSLAFRCGPEATIPMPSTEAAYIEARDRLLQTRTLTTPGPVLNDLESALSDLEKGYRLCSAFERLGLPGHTHWNRIGAELGSHFARVVYWSAQRQSSDWETVQKRGIEYLEAARDEGYVPAFHNIGMMYGGLIVDGPYGEHQTEALAHLYAALDLRRAIIAGRDDSGYYADEPFLRRVDTSREAMSLQFVNEFEMQVSPYQMQAARERADELLDRCCR